MNNRIFVNTILDVYNIDHDRVYVFLRKLLNWSVFDKIEERRCFRNTIYRIVTNTLHDLVDLSLRFYLIIY